MVEPKHPAKTELPSPEGTIDVSDVRLTDIQWQPGEWEHDLNQVREPYDHETVKVEVGECQFNFNGKRYTLKAKKAEYALSTRISADPVSMGVIECSVVHNDSEVLRLLIHHGMNEVGAHMRTIRYNQEHKGLGMTLYSALLPQFAQHLANRNKMDVEHLVTHGARIVDTLPYDKWITIFQPFLDKKGYRHKYGTFPETFAKIYSPESTNILE